VWYFSRFEEAIKAVARERTDDDEFARAIVVDCSHKEAGNGRRVTFEPGFHWLLV
jgi:hypothetical protein